MGTTGDHRRPFQLAGPLVPTNVPTGFLVEIEKGL